jgi:glycosyltransferase involved in cell wall biosynthesis/MoaA/NifB/PqqE/SkfB family radical SAM enzyme
MRICFFNDITVLGGGEIWVLNACQELADMGHEVMVICPWRSPLNDACLKKDIRVFTFMRMEGLPVYEPLYFFLKNNNVDILYCTVIGNFCESGVLGAMVDKLNGQRADNKVALILKTGLPPMAGLTKAHYGLTPGMAASRLHVVSKSIKADFMKWVPTLENDFIEVMYEGTRYLDQTNLYTSHAAIRLQYGVPGVSKIITNLARLHSMKGQDYLLNAVPSILSKFPDTFFIFAGDGDKKEELKNLALDLGITDSVKFPGHIGDVRPLLTITDVLCHPSFIEGIPNAIVEAMSEGVAVVASDVGGISEILTHQENGLLIQSQNVNQISDAVIELLSDDNLRYNLGRQAKKFITENFSFRKNIQLLVARFEKELDQLNNGKSTDKIKAGIKNKPIRIMFLMNNMRLGGEEREVQVLARNLDPSSYAMSVLSLQPTSEISPMTERIRKVGVEVNEDCHSLSWDDKLRYVVNFVRNQEIRIVVACQDTRYAYEIFKHISPSSCRLIEHGGIILETGLIPKDRTSRYIAVSGRIQRAAAALMDQPQHALFIPSAVDSTEFEGLDKQKLREYYGFSQETFFITFAGRIDPKKRVEDLLEISDSLTNLHPNVVIMIIGGHDHYQPEYAQNIVRNFDNLRQSGKLIFTGARKDVAYLLKVSDVLVLPSLEEGMSHVICEAGLAGLAVVACDNGAAREQLSDGRGGVLIPERSPQVLKTALLNLIEDPLKREELGSYLKKTVEERYDIKKILPLWEGIFDEVYKELPEPHQICINSWDKRLDFPAEIQIQTTTLCNASCIMCPYPEVSKEFEAGKMQNEVFSKLLAECANEPGLRRIEPFLMNESFTDKRIIEFIKEAKTKVPHAMVTITTNGSPLVPQVTDKLITSGLDAIWFSFNGATKATYEKIMGISYDKVKSNIDYLLAVKPPSLQVFVNMIDTEVMLPEIEENIKYWTKRGVQAGSSPLVNRAGNVKNFEELNQAVLSNDPIRTCELVFYKMYILYNGDAVLCCMDWRRHVVLGNVFQNSIREIWNGEKYEHIRRLHIEGRDNEIDLCAGCSYTLR